MSTFEAIIEIFFARGVSVQSMEKEYTVRLIDFTSNSGQAQMKQMESRQLISRLDDPKTTYKILIIYGRKKSGNKGQFIKSTSFKSQDTFTSQVQALAEQNMRVADEAMYFTQISVVQSAQISQQQRTIEQLMRLNRQLQSSEKTKDEFILQVMNQYKRYQQTSARNEALLQEARKQLDQANQRLQTLSSQNQRLFEENIHERQEKTIYQFESFSISQHLERKNNNLNEIRNSIDRLIQINEGDHEAEEGIHDTLSNIFERYRQQVNSTRQSLSRESFQQMIERAREEIRRYRVLKFQQFKDMISHLFE